MTTHGQQPAAPRFNPFDKQLIASPYPAYRALQAEEPLHWNPVIHAWVVSRMPDVQAILTDGTFKAIKTSSVLAEFARRSGRDYNDLIRFLDAILFFKEGEAHERDRRTISKIVNRIKLSELNRLVIDIADRLVEPLRNADSFDVISNFADSFPQLVMAHVLGLPASDVPVMSDLSANLTLVFDPVAMSTYDRISTSLKAALQLFADRISEAGSTPSSGLHAIYEGASGEGQEKLRNAAATALFTFRVGAETTIGLVGLLIKTLLDNPELRDALEADPALVDVVVSEVLRLEGNVQRAARIATEEREIGGASIAAGDRLLLLLGAANRDPAVFEEPDKVELQQRRPGDLAFGAGKHFCLGASLARLEGRVALQAFLKLPRLEQAGRESWFEGRTIRRLTSLPVRVAGVIR